MRKQLKKDMPEIVGVLIVLVIHLIYVIGNICHWHMAEVLYAQQETSVDTAFFSSASYLNHVAMAEFLSVLPVVFPLYCFSSLYAENTDGLEYLRY